MDRVWGCIIGGAIGDALGGAYENAPVPVEIDDTEEWELSDDTQLTLATCEAIIEADGKAEPELIAARFAEWHKQGRITGIGASTLKALTELVAGGHWALVGRKGDRAAGNGAAMRIAPLAFCLNLADQSARRTIRDVARITHHHEEAYAGALAVALAIKAILNGQWNGHESLLRLVAKNLPDTAMKDRLNSLDELDASVLLPEIAERFGNSGFVVESVPLALCGANRIGRLGFQAMLAELIACGGDTDTIASIAGQVAGTLIGSSQLPASMVFRLPERELIETVASKFAKAVKFND
ncbi:MAG: ADP-ribosylglycohydrolase family protein [Acidobacteriota bacterium]|nr:ADP-ribosylglycohydrolase family protein [Acidobacteriota bacterium]